jgi:hypothetical protein
MSALTWVVLIVVIALVALVLRLAFVVGGLVRRVTKLEADVQHEQEEHEVLIGEVQQAFSAWGEAFKFDGR